MYQLERTAAATIQLTASGSAPIELLQAALRGVLEAARGDRPASAPSNAVAVPVRGLGDDLGLLFVDLCQDLISQLAEFGPGWDDLRLDGLLRTDTGGYTAWGYLSGGPLSDAQPLLALTVQSPVIVETEGELRLACEVRPG